MSLNWQPVGGTVTGNAAIPNAALTCVRLELRFQGSDNGGEHRGEHHRQTSLCDPFFCPGCSMGSPFRQRHTPERPGRHRCGRDAGFRDLSAHRVDSSRDFSLTRSR